MKFLQALMIADIALLAFMPVLLEILHARPWFWYFTAMMLMLFSILILDQMVSLTRRNDRTSRPDHSEG